LPVDVKKYGGTAGTFASGIPSVNTTQFAGQTITAAAGVTIPASIASPTNITAGTITTLTNLPSIPSGWLTAAGIAADAVTEIQSGLATQTSVDDLPTNAELATALGTADDVVLAAIATVQSDTNDIQTRLPAALEGGRIAAALDSATETKINKIEAAVAGTVTGAGTSTEVFVGPSATLTITVDSSGNRSAVVVT
jgi:hypothetical protein